ncbi:MAG: glycoside hydrolase family 2 [Chloroflexota bacterium]|nr:glycoside hydrolase family 2 [Chloroflexota bacterium]
MSLSEVHPRPLLTRQQWTDLCGTWSFAYDDENIGLDEHWYEREDVFGREIVVPFPPESRASGIGEPGFHPTVWYRRSFTISPDHRHGRVLLHFGAVDYSAEVWVNGRLVASHQGGHTPFSADITAALGDDEQVVIVRAEDHPDDLSQPRGKQDWQPLPHKIWYHRTTGIWQPVWLEPVRDVYISDVCWMPDLDRGMLGLQLSLNVKPDHALRLRVRISLNGDVLADDTSIVAQAHAHREFALDAGKIAMDRDLLLWSPRFPNLLDVELELLDGEQVVDSVGSYAGIRSCGFAGGQFILNGRPMFLRMVLGQNYWPESHLAAPSAEALKREVELIKELGFNGVRIHQKVEDPRFLYWCDRLGVLVWGEMANAYTFSPPAVERFTREWMEVVRRDRSHPCIVTWVPFNESWGVPNLEWDPAQRDYVRALYHLTQAIDPSRPTIGNDGWEHLVGDVWGIHDYALEGTTLTERYGTREAFERTVRDVRPHYRLVAFPETVHAGEPVVLTEFGGISYRPEPGERWHGYGTVKSMDEFLDKYRELVDAVLASQIVVGFCYTQLTDTEQETNGLLTEDRIPKLDPAVIRAINQGQSTSVPGEIISSIQYAAAVTMFQGAGSPAQ